MDHIENYDFNNSSIVACVFIAMVTVLPSHCLATVGDIHTNGRDLLSISLRWAQVP
jgi:hypothetical protein